MHDTRACVGYNKHAPSWIVGCEVHRGGVLVRMDCRLQKPAHVLQRPHAAGKCAVRAVQGGERRGAGHVCGRRAGPSHRLAPGVRAPVSGLRGHGRAPRLHRHSPARASFFGRRFFGRPFGFSGLSVLRLSVLRLSVLRLSVLRLSSHGVQSVDDGQRLLFGF